jgi:hypothetical protein
MKTTNQTASAAESGKVIPALNMDGEGYKGFAFQYDGQSVVVIKQKFIHERNENTIVLSPKEIDALAARFGAEHAALNAVAEAANELRKKREQCYSDSEPNPEHAKLRQALANLAAIRGGGK